MPWEHPDSAIAVLQQAARENPVEIMRADGQVAGERPAATDAATQDRVNANVTGERLAIIDPADQKKVAAALKEIGIAPKYFALTPHGIEIKPQAVNAFEMALRIPVDNDGQPREQQRRPRDYGRVMTADDVRNIIQDPKRLKWIPDPPFTPPAVPATVDVDATYAEALRQMPPEAQERFFHELSVYDDFNRKLTLLDGARKDQVRGAPIYQRYEATAMLLEELEGIPHTDKEAVKAAVARLESARGPAPADAAIRVDVPIVRPGEVLFPNSPRGVDPSRGEYGGVPLMPSGRETAGVARNPVTEVKAIQSGQPALHMLAIYGGIKAADPNASDFQRATGVGMAAASTVSLVGETAGLTKTARVSGKVAAPLLPIMSGHATVEHARQGNTVGATLNGAQTVSGAAAAAETLVPATAEIGLVRLAAKPLVPLAIAVEAYNIQATVRAIRAVQRDTDRMNQDNADAMTQAGRPGLNERHYQQYLAAQLQTDPVTGQLSLTGSPLDLQPPSDGSYRNLGSARIITEAVTGKRQFGDVLMDSSMMTEAIEKLESEKTRLVREVHEHPLNPKDKHLSADLRNYDDRQKMKQDMELPRELVAQASDILFQNPSAVIPKAAWDQQRPRLTPETARQQQEVYALLERMDDIDQRIATLKAGRVELGVHQDPEGKFPSAASSAAWKNIIDTTKTTYSAETSAKLPSLREHVKKQETAVQAEDRRFEDVYNAASRMSGRKLPEYEAYERAQQTFSKKEADWGKAPGPEKAAREYETLLARDALLRTQAEARTATLRLAETTLVRQGQANAQLQQAVVGLASQVKTAPAMDAEGLRRQHLFQQADQTLEQTGPALRAAAKVPGASEATRLVVTQELLLRQLELEATRGHYLIHTRDAFEKQRYQEMGVSLSLAPPNPATTTTGFPPPRSQTVLPQPARLTFNIPPRDHDGQRLSDELTQMGIDHRYDPKKGMLAIGQDSLAQYAAAHPDQAKRDEKGALALSLPSGKSLTLEAKPAAPLATSRTLMVGGVPVTVLLPSEGLAYSTNPESPRAPTPFTANPPASSPSRK